MMKFGYTVLLISLVMFFLLYADNLSLIILAAALMLPIFLLTALLLSAGKVRISLSAANTGQPKGGEAEICLRMENGSVFPVSAVTVTVSCGFLPCGKEELHTVTVPLPARESCSVSIRIGSAYCRRAVCEIRTVKIYDYIHLFSVRKKDAETTGTTVDFLPSGDAPLSPSDESKISVAESVSGEASFSASFFNQELDELREYRDGDKLNRVAWKLSGKTGDEIIVRDGSPGREQVYLLVMDSASAEGSEQTADRLFELFYSAAQTMCRHEISFDSMRADGSIITGISASDGLDLCIRGIYGEAVGTDALSENRRNRRYDKIVLITASENSSTAEKLVKAYGARESVIISGGDAPAGKSRR